MQFGSILMMVSFECDEDDDDDDPVVFFSFPIMIATQLCFGDYFALLTDKYNYESFRGYIMVAID